METLIEIMTPIEVWHWVALGLILIGIEVAAGTFDLLFVGLAAFATAAFKALAPEAITGWPWQVAVFAVSSIVLIVLSRTVFSDMRNRDNQKPGLNQRMVAMIGKRGIVASDFEAGAGRVKIGDTEWSAESVDGTDVSAGETVIVESAVLTTLKVRLA
ncbi:MAG: NfeD family protein [Pseudomonadota bacterium]